MAATNKVPKIHPDIRDIWIVAKVVQMTIGFNLGLYLYTYGVFFYESFGGAKNPTALKLAAVIFIIGNAVMLISDVPMGALADYMGRKKTVILTFLFRAIFFFLMAWVCFIPSTRSAFILSAVAYTCFGISYTLYSGSFVAWIVDSIRERKRSEGHGVILARSYAHMTLAEIIGALIGLSLYLKGYIFYAFSLGFTSCILCAVFCAVVMKETQNLNFYQGKLSWKNSSQRMKKIIVNGFKASVQTPAVTYLMLMYASFMFLINTVSYLWPIAMKSNFGAGKMSPYWYLIVFLSLTLCFVGSKMMEWLSHNKKGSDPNGTTSNVTTWIWFVLFALIMSVPVAYLGIKTQEGNITLPLFIVTVAFSRFAYGFLRPAYETLINNYIPPQYSQERATIMSFASMLSSVVVILLMIPSAGKTGEATTVGWLIPSGLLLFLTIILYFFMRRYQRKIGELPKKTIQTSEST